MFSKTMHVRTLLRATNLSDCCAQCSNITKCGAFTFRGTETAAGHCLLAEGSSAPGKESNVYCGSARPLPPPSPPSPPPPPSPPLPPLPPTPPGIAIPHTTQWSDSNHPIMHDDTGFLRDPSAPIQDPVDGKWHAWVVWVDPKYGEEGWSGYIKHFATNSSNLLENWTNYGFAMNHSSDPLAFDHSGMCSPGSMYDAETKKWYLFYTGATPVGTTGYPPRTQGATNMDNLSAQGVAVSDSPYGPWKRLGIVAPGGLGWLPGGKGGGYRKNVWNGLRVDSGRALVVNGVKLYSTKGIGNGTEIPSSNPTGSYQALQGVFFPANNSAWDAFPYFQYRNNPVTRANNNTFSIGGAENCEFIFSPKDQHLHAVQRMGDCTHKDTCNTILSL
eukprot:m.184726 g.184726  ORF g.184726 m.184726 type:complete len:387 (-) comp15562_c0_seq2:187-1347(-)